MFSFMFNYLCQYKVIYILFDEFDSGFTLLFMIMEKRYGICKVVDEGAGGRGRNHFSIM